MRLLFSLSRFMSVCYICLVLFHRTKISNFVSELLFANSYLLGVHSCTFCTTEHLPFSNAICHGWSIFNVSCYLLLMAVGLSSPIFMYSFSDGMNF